MAIDPYWDKVVLLLPMEGANDVPIVQDLKGHGIIVSGNAKLSTAQSPVSVGSSLYLDGTDSPGSYIYTADSEDWHFATFPYTIEFWIYIVALDATETWLLHQSNGVGGKSPVHIKLSTTGQIVVDGSITNSGWHFTGLSTSALSLSTWYHIEVSDDGTTFRVFVDGAVGASRATWSKNDSSYPLTLGGGYSSGDRESNIYLGPVRITKGVARHTSAFSIPTTRFPSPIIQGTVLDNTAAPVARTVFFHDRSTQEYIGGVISDGTTGDYTFYPPDFGEVTATMLWEEADPHFGDVVLAARLTAAGFPTLTGQTLTTTGTVTSSSAEADPFGGALPSALFAGGGSYLAVSGYAGSKYLTGSFFTLQTWVRLDSFDATGNVLLYIGDLVYNNNRTVLAVNPTGAINFFAVDNAATNPYSVVSADGVITLSTWHHIAGVRNGPNVYLFVDGALVMKAVASGTESNSGVFYIGGGRYFNATRGLNGRLFDVRFSHRAEYLTPFTPPTALLLTGPSDGGSGEEAFIYDRVIPGAWGG